ncbi:MULTISPECIES: hypothetical protein [Rhizobium]|uniref:Uncharacterized protein n=1 Tax=Rhizobium tropici TaxID=398 RepID=A0A6P1C1M4_RHITR|nr:MULTISPECIES: hypothetical protein [Rhizobium]MBB4240225.1 hypothetical protein [Rhizobium tropici]MBB5591495.1 hypothetical protein [Rhizobium tropici]MBB6490421.1 hypothetical protein [Rhizobium tropici]NEV11089.1 hypothetical protein [Rhizobium tropici]
MIIEFALADTPFIDAMNADAYYDIKDPIFDIIMDGANAWVRQVGCSEPRSG